jgi:hypothetical protein
MMRQFALSGALMLALLGAVSSRPQAAPITQQIENLKQTLEQVLRARRQEEFDFIARVVGLVDAGTLPREMVESTMLWVRKKNPKRPFPYFEQALRVRAKEIGVEL